MLPNIIPLRGKQLPDTNVTYLTKSELDAIAPLHDGDAQEMGEFNFPNSDVISRMDARIRAAKRLKYGVVE